MLKTLSFLRSLCWITLRKPRDLSHVFGVANSVAQDIGRFFRNNLLAASAVPLNLGGNLAPYYFSVLWA